MLLVEYLIGHVKVKLSLPTKSTQTEDVDDHQHNGWDMKDITNEVKQVAEQCMNDTGLNYDKSSGTYYNSEQGYYYNPEYKLYYYPRLGAYYYYDETADSLKFHSFVNTEESTTAMSKVKTDDKEEGELSSSDDEDGEITEETNSKVIFESGPKAFEPDHSKHNAPCMRMVIVKTNLENYKVGTLFLITRDGGTLGREGAHHEIVLPECNISKEHLKFQYVYKGDTEQRYAYEVIDLGSRNGTWVNGKRLSSPNEQSKSEEISHGTVLTIGSTTLLCHIHNGMDFCSECQTPEVPLLKEGSAATKLSTKKQHHKQLMQIKQKYQLNTTVEGNCLPEGYVDRAKARRNTVGSSHHSEKTEVSSVHLPMNKTNKGYNLLSKMGWKEGKNLGRNNNTSSLQEPLYVEPKIGKGGFGTS
ncbi:hypothetical protein O3M35_013128 [Rhynocoris fuscipes]|uniref:Angiogenic factor with G patch and FHA domains 1 n=1 Tax=Rhynocoris fuscipes TaxID=488301 RepID=A0AAW1CER3_9HEMI